MSCFQIRIEEPGPLYVRLFYDESCGHLRINSWDPTPHGGPGPIEISNTVQVGDSLISINRISLVGTDFKASIRAIKTALKPRVITFYRHITSQTPILSRLSPSNMLIDDRSTKVSPPYPLRQRRQVLNAPTIDECDVRKISSEGFPSDSDLTRSLAWKLLLRYLPLNRSIWHDRVKSHRALYSQFLREFTMHDAQRDIFESQ